MVVLISLDFTTRNFIFLVRHIRSKLSEFKDPAAAAATVTSNYM